MVGVEEGREFRFRGDLYSQESTFPLVKIVATMSYFKTEMHQISISDGAPTQTPLGSLHRMRHTVAAYCYRCCNSACDRKKYLVRY